MAVRRGNNSLTEKEKKMKKKIICAFLALVMIIGVVGVLGSCKEETPPPCETHEDKDGDKVCDVCGEKITVKKHSHKDADKDGVCDVAGCGKEMGGGGNEEDPVDYYWDSVDLIYQMVKYDSDQLSSTCERYLAGEYKGTKDDIDVAVQERNDAAYDHARIGTIDFAYYPNTEEYGWGDTCPIIMKEIQSLDTEGLPDMYVSMIYDMVAASLQGCFANLYGTTRGQHNNYFPFLEFRDAVDEGTFNEVEEGQGYMYEYMTTLTLSKQKMYLLASDYFVDLVRAFFIVPVNIKLLEEVGPDLTGDLVGNNGFTIDDFYEEVKQGKWTYNRLAEYSAAISKEGENVGVKDLSDRIGFALNAQGGLTPSGVIYSTNCTIIERTWDAAAKDYTYAYPKNNEKLFDLSVAIANLITKKGVHVVQDTNDWNRYGSTSTDAIRKRFAADQVLFGDIILIGALEDQTFQSMKDSKGFGIVPVPLYADDLEDTYLTQIHNEGRIGAISVKTQKFEQCTAYLGYLSTHSTDILDDYYNIKLQYEVVDADPGTVYMMQYIRNNVRSAFDKTFEDAMGMFYQKTENRWHDRLMQSKYTLGEQMRQIYNELYPEKVADLKNLVTFYVGLPE